MKSRQSRLGWELACKAGKKKLKSRKKAGVPESCAGGMAQKSLAGSKYMIVVDSASPKICL